MKSFFLYNLGLILLLLSCKNEEQDNSIEIQKSIKQKELVFNSLDKAWFFSERKLTPESEFIALNWNEWRLFINELKQKPKSSISAFKLKTKNLVQKVDLLPNTIPIKLQKPQINVRLSVIITKVKALNMFLNIDRIPEKRVIKLVSDLNLEVNAFNDQIEEIVRRNHIQMEEGEEDMIKHVGGKKLEPLVKPDIQNPQVEEVPSFEEIK
ncbi:hypothetical protein [Flavobacterium columnare]|uniref:Lipoprotein n=1 Tax=Flavobacterium columnare (strain ATCC 49512 / CIP 103533 / TG 44/87) TaxID=1041826 RepID=G8X8M7_FLACA|nr:hypothetical protein [Flavobacterium columnare]AEW86478.1 hypothetical protein FCOL_08315 [Flavobacterium columnare ATCC 49512]MBF6656195.1 hypothetical protein [Flavobacterium columnare]MBF6658513.1 hypothetical protein [Flavobacterium columnare]PTD13960.1 hypothetical protein C6N29_05660 [Flavobacterium columnare]